MKKRIFAIFLVILLAVTNLTVCYADSVIDQLTDINLENYGDTIDKTFSSHNDATSLNTGLDVTDETITGILKLFISILSFIPKIIVNALIKIIELIVPSMDKIVFNDRWSLWGQFFRLSYFDKYQTGLAGELVTLVSTMYQTFRYIAIIGFIIAISVIAVKMIISSVGKQKAQYKESLKNWLIGLVLLVVGHWIMIYSIYFSDYLVNVLGNVKQHLGYVKIEATVMEGIDNGKNIGDTEGALPSISNHVTAVTVTIGETLAETANSITRLGSFDLAACFSSAVGANGAALFTPSLFIIWAVLAIVAIVVYIAMNMKIAKIYLERVIVVGVLIMIFPLVTIFYAFEKSGIKKGNTFGAWLRSFMDQVFIQPVHALALIGVCVALDAMSNLAITAIPIIGMLFVLMTLNMVFTIENAVKRVFAINGAALGAPINPVGAITTGLALGMPAAKEGAKAFKAFKVKNPNAKGSMLGVLKATKGQKGIKGKFNAIKNGGLGVAYDAAFKQMFSGNRKFRSGKRLLGFMGLNLPLEEMFGLESLNMTEQKKVGETIKRRMNAENAGGEEDLGTMQNINSFENMLSSDVIGEIYERLNNSPEAIALNSTGKINSRYIRSIRARGPQNEHERLLLRKYYSMLHNPDADVSKLNKPEFNHFTSTSDADLMDQLSYGTAEQRNLALSTFALRHPAEYSRYESALKNPDGTWIGGDEKLARELLAHQCAGSKIKVEDCFADGKLNEELITNLGASDSKIRRALRLGEHEGLTREIARKIYRVRNSSNAQQIETEIEINIPDVEFSKIDEKLNNNEELSDSEILALEIRNDMFATGNKLETYKNENGQFEVPEGYIMNASELIGTMNKIIRTRNITGARKVFKQLLANQSIIIERLDDGTKEKINSFVSDENNTLEFSEIEAIFRLVKHNLNN